MPPAPHAALGATYHRVPVPAGIDPIPLVMDHFNISLRPTIVALNGQGSRPTVTRGTPDETLVPGVVVFDRQTDQPLSISGYRRAGVTMTERIITARMLPPHALPGNFFDPPPFSLPDRAPAVYRWLHHLLPCHP